MLSIQTSNWVLIGTSLFLGACALFVPYLAELLKRKLFAPKIQVRFRLSPPLCHKTLLCSPPVVSPRIEEPAYYFRFMIMNEGKSRANNCEIYLEKLWVYDASQSPILHSNFFPINIAWSGNQSQKFINVNPEREMYCDIGHVSSEKYQHNFENKNFVDIYNRPSDELRFMFELPQYFYSQPNCLLPGRYIIQIGFYSENAGTQKVFFDISWSGKWQDTENEMFKEIVIKITSEPKIIDNH